VENIDDPFQERYSDPYRCCRSGGGDRPRSRIRGQAEPLSAGSLSGPVRRLPVAGHRRVLPSQGARLRRLCQGVRKPLLRNSLWESRYELLPAGGPGGSPCRIRLWGLSDGRMPAHGVTSGSIPIPASVVSPGPPGRCGEVVQGTIRHLPNPAGIQGRREFRQQGWYVGSPHLVALAMQPLQAFGQRPLSPADLRRDLSQET
jgi:hypothetical protein